MFANASAAGLGIVAIGRSMVGMAIPVASFLAGSVMGFMRGGARVRKRRQAMHAFDALWGEGALGLELPTAETCSSFMEKTTGRS